MVNLYKKIHLVMKDVSYLQKDDVVKVGQTSSYKAISEEKVTIAVREALIKHGLIILPVEQVHTKEAIIKDNEHKGFLTTVDVKYKVIDIETGESEIVVSSGTGVDTQDKGVGKSSTYAWKYLLLRLFAIPTGEDPDKISSVEWDNKFESKKEPALEFLHESHITENQKSMIESLITEVSKKKNVNREEMQKSLIAKFGEFEDLDKKRAGQLIDLLKARK